MKDFIKQMLIMQGWYFTPESVARKLHLTTEKKDKPKMDVVIGNPPFAVSE